jgi:hypothetical protein
MSMLRTYDLFEVMPNGDLIWKATVEGHESAIEKLWQAARGSPNEFKAMHLPTMTVIATINAEAD